MATFILQAQAATFYDCGTLKMVSVAFGAPALAREVIEAKNLDALQIHFDRVKAALAQAGRPYSLSAILPKHERAPKGWNDRRLRFRADEDFGQCERAA